MAARKPKIVYFWSGGRVRWSFYGSDGYKLCESSNSFADRHNAWWDVVRVVSAITGGTAIPAIGTCGPGAVREEGPGRKPESVLL